MILSLFLCVSLCKFFRTISLRNNPIQVKQLVIIVLNIAAGCSESSEADRKYYFTTAGGSVLECDAILDIMNQHKDLNEEASVENLKLVDELSSLLNNMITIMNNT